MLICLIIIRNHQKHAKNNHPQLLNIVTVRFACTGNAHIFFWQYKNLFCCCVSFALLSLDVSTSQTQQPHASQASEQREHLSSPSKKKWKSTLRKPPCLHLSSLLRWLHPREDKKILLASMDPAPSNYGSLLWEPPPPKKNSLKLILWGGSSPCPLAKMYNGQALGTVL